MKRTQSNYQIKIYSQITQQSISKVNEIDCGIGNQNGQQEQFESSRSKRDNISIRIVKGDKENRCNLANSYGENPNLLSMEKCKLKILKKNQQLGHNHFQNKTKFNPEISSQEQSSLLEQPISTLAIEQNPRQQSAFQNKIYEIEISFGKIYYKYCLSNSNENRLVLIYNKLKEKVNYVEMTQNQLKIGKIKQTCILKSSDLTKAKQISEILNLSELKIYTRNRKREINQPYCSQGINYCEDIPSSIKKLIDYCLWVKQKIQVFVRERAQQQYNSVQQTSLGLKSQADSPIKNFSNQENSYKHQYSYRYGIFSIMLTIQNSGEASISIHKWNKGISTLTQTLKFNSFQKIIIKEYQQYLVNVMGQKIYESILQTYAKYWFQNVADF